MFEKELIVDIMNDIDAGASLFEVLIRDNDFISMYAYTDVNEKKSIDITFQMKEDKWMGSIFVHGKWWLGCDDIALAYSLGSDIYHNIKTNRVYDLHNYLVKLKKEFGLFGLLE